MVACMGGLLFQILSMASGCGRWSSKQALLWQQCRVHIY